MPVVRGIVIDVVMPGLLAPTLIAVMMILIATICTIRTIIIVSSIPSLTAINIHITSISTSVTLSVCFPSTPLRHHPSIQYPRPQQQQNHHRSIITGIIISHHGHHRGHLAETAIPDPLSGFDQCKVPPN